MFSVVLSHSPLGSQVIFQLGFNDGVLGFFGMPLPLVILAGVAIFCLAATRANGPQGCDPRGRSRWAGRRFWVVPLVVCVVVLASRGLDNQWHGRLVIDPDEHPVVVRRERLEDAVSRLEKQLDRASNQVDRALDRGANQVDGQLDRGAADVERQVDRGTAEMVRQLEHTAAQIIRQLEHVGQQLAQRRQITPRHPDAPRRVEVTVAQASEDPAVIEPSPPALPILGFVPADIVIQGPSPAVPAATPPATSAAEVAPATQPSTPAPPVTAPVSGKASSSPPTEAVASDDTASDKLPEWTKTEILDEGNRKLVVVPGGFAGSQKEAERDALAAARLVVGDAIQRVYPKVGKWLPSAEAVREDAVRLTYVEKIHRKTLSSGTPFIVYRAYHQVELSPSVFTQLVSSWKEEIVPRRLEALGGFAALLTLTFATGAAYFRLDDRTHGRYRGRLKLAACSVIAAGVAAATLMI